MFQNPVRLLAHAISAPLGDQDGLMLSERESVNLLCSLPAASATHTSRAPARSLTKAIGGCVARSLPCESPAKVSVTATTTPTAATTRTTICASVPTCRSSTPRIRPPLREVNDRVGA